MKIPRPTTFRGWYLYVLVLTAVLNFLAGGVLVGFHLSWLLVRLLCAITFVESFTICPNFAKVFYKLYAN